MGWCLQVSSESLDFSHSKGILISRHASTWVTETSATGAVDLGVTAMDINDRLVNNLKSSLSTTISNQNLYLPFFIVKNKIPSNILQLLKVTPVPNLLGDTLITKK
jgi:hypothetical protein